jgi:ABC-type phosphate transport system substrate-binding protein
MSILLPGIVVFNFSRLLPEASRGSGFPVTYDAVGSADGVDQLCKGSVDIVASDIDVISEAGFSPVKVHLYPTGRN